MGDPVAIDFNALTYSSDTLLSSNFVMSPKCCIFKIPNILSRHNEKAYAPGAFSIGPWHLGKPHLEPAQKIKKKYLQGLLVRSSTQLGILENAIRAVVNNAEDCYAGPVEIDVCDCNARPVVPSSEDLVKILVLDGCFIIELFRKSAKVVPNDNDDPIFTMSCMLQFLHHDLILLENQIPWFVLKCLFNLTKTSNDSKPLHQLAIEFFSNIFSSQNSLENMINALEPTKFWSHESMQTSGSGEGGCNHILDLLRNWLILSYEVEGSNQNLESRSGERGSNQTSGSGEGGSNQASGSGEGRSNQTSGSGERGSNQTKNEVSSLGWQPLPSATSLEEAGIKFRKVTSNSILDVKFRNGVLEMPSLLVQETTETIFRNLISLEQCTPNYRPIITSYAKLIDNLIDTTKDMEILCNQKIIDNWLNLEDGTQFFNKLYNDTYVKEFCHHDLCDKVNAYCEIRRHRWRANLMHNYFYSPWAIGGIIVAGLILVSTIIGAVCSILQVT